MLAFSTIISAKFFSCCALILFLLVNSRIPENAVTVSNLVYFFAVHNLLNINLGFFISSLNISFTLLVTVTVSVIAIFSMFIAFLLIFDLFFSNKFL